MAALHTHNSHADGRTLRAERRRRERRHQILRAAKTVFARDGYRDTSISSVIDAAGISRGTFYSYFESKDALFRQLVESLVEEMTGAVEAVEPGRGERPLLDTFSNVQRVVDLLFSDRELATVVFRVAVGVDAEVDQIIGRLYRYLYNVVELALARGAEWGHIRAVNQKLVAVAVVGAIKETLYHYSVVEPEDTPDGGSVTRTLFDLVLDGLAV